MLHVLAFPDDAAGALALAAPVLARRPVRYTLLLTLLSARSRNPEPGRYWVAQEDERVVAVAFHSPLAYPAVVFAASAAAVRALAAAMHASDAVLPGVNAEPETAARFAGEWTNLHGAAAMPTRATRLYEARRLRSGPARSGFCRAAGEADRATLVAWVGAFRAEIREPEIDAARYVDRALAAGDLWVWDDGGAACMVGTSPGVEGVIRIAGVYVPPERRGRGYARACVEHVTRDVLARGQRCALYADLANPIATGMYRAIGYVSVSELLTLAFTPPPPRGAASGSRTRNAGLADVDAMIAMFPRIFEKPGLVERFRAAVTDAEVIVLDDEGTCSAFAWIQPHGFFGHAFLNLLAVREDRRRQGHAEVLLAAAERTATTDRVFSSTNASNAAMHALFAKRGWTRCGEIDALDPADPEIVYVFRIAPIAPG